MIYVWYIHYVKSNQELKQRILNTCNYFKVIGFAHFYDKNLHYNHRNCLSIKHLIFCRLYVLMLCFPDYLQLLLTSCTRRVWQCLVKIVLRLIKVTSDRFNGSGSVTCSY